MESAQQIKKGGKKGSQPQQLGIEYRSADGGLPISHASLFPLPGNKGAREMTAISGRKCLELSRSLDPVGLLEKMLLGSSIWASMTCWLTWKPRPTPQGRLLFQLVPLVRHTDETDFGLWATPNTMDHLPPRSEEALDHHLKHQRPGRTKPGNLREQVDPKTRKLWPTPRAVNPGSRPNGKGGKVLEEEARISEGLRARGQKLFPTPRASSAMNDSTESVEKRLDKTGYESKLEQAVRMWPTPTTQDAKNNGGPSQHDRNSKPLNAEVGGSLNPQFVEFLMNYPKDWTRVD